MSSGTGLKRWDEVIRRFKPGQKIRVAEVGVWQGKMSFHLLQGLPGLELYMIDRWEPPEPDDSYYNSGSEISRRAKTEHNAAYHRSVGIASKFPGRAHIIRAESADAANRFPDESFDLVFIDADHSYEGVKRDIEIWRSKVKPGGWLSGHDYDHPDQGGVKKAVDEMFPGGVTLGGNRTWFLKIN